MPVEVHTPIYRKNGTYWKDAECTQPFTDQDAAKVLWKQKHGPDLGDALKNLAGFALTTFVIVVCYGAWDYAEEQGWRYHDELAKVQSRAWANGEYKPCVSLSDNNDFLLTCEAAGDSKVFKVRFYGKVRINSKTESHERQWRCRKNNGVDPAITCEKGWREPTVLAFTIWQAADRIL